MLKIVRNQAQASRGCCTTNAHVFFKLILVGYLENLCSDRRIINMARLRLDMLYFIGYDIDEPLPWHSTLSRTRQLYGEELFKQIFRKVLAQCIEKGMVAGKRQAMDSVAVQANASMDSLLKKEILADGNDFAAALKNSEEEPSSDASGSDKSSASANNQKSYSPTDKDARISVKPGKTRRLNYLAQVSVDTANHVITQIQSEYADLKKLLKWQTPKIETAIVVMKREKKPFLPNSVGTSLVETSSVSKYFFLLTQR